MVAVHLKKLHGHCKVYLYSEIAEHFNALYELIPALYGSAGRFLGYCYNNLNALPTHGDFVESFLCITQNPKNPVNPV